ncbi:MAG: DUF6273 domain-containing protein [Clostridiales bacterium]|nr:DUF6273 domain-containing protein [Clostridiales bacterium]
METSEGNVLSPLDNAKELIEIADKTLLLKYREKYYLEAISILKELNGEEAESQLKSATKKLNIAKAEGIISKYKECRKEEKQCSSPKDIDSVGNHYASTAKLIEETKIDEKYLSEDLLKKLHDCDDSAQRAKKLHKKSSNSVLGKRIAFLVVILLIFAAVIGLSIADKTEGYHIALGKIFDKVGFDGKAKDQYLLSYNDFGSEKGYNLYTEKLIAELKESISEGDFKEAIVRCKNLDKIGCTDFEHLHLEAEKGRIAQAKPGNVIYFAKTDWYLADRSGDRVLLIKKSSFDLTPDMADFDKDKNLTWESSTIRSYLNGDYLKQGFTDGEIRMITSTKLKADKNPIYGTSGGNDTEDRVFLISTEELEKYSDYINKTTKRCWWTRTSGAHEGSLVFVDIDKAVLYYGYEMTESDIKVKPAMWIDLNQ